MSLRSGEGQPEMAAANHLTGEPPQQRPRSFGPSAIAGLMVIVGLLFCVWLQAPAGTDLLVRSGLVPAAKPFLELYFSDPLAHPRVVAPGDTVPVSFVLSSHEGDFVGLSWKIETIRGSERRLVASGSETVPDGDTRTVARDARVSCNPAAKVQRRVQVRVSVVEPKRQILYWVICRPGSP